MLQGVPGVCLPELDQVRGGLSRLEKIEADLLRLEQPTRNSLKVYQWFSARGKCPGVKPSCILQLEVMVATGI